MYSLGYMERYSDILHDFHQDETNLGYTIKEKLDGVGLTICFGREKGKAAGASFCPTSVILRTCVDRIFNISTVNSRSFDLYSQPFAVLPGPITLSDQFDQNAGQKRTIFYTFGGFGSMGWDPDKKYPRLVVVSNAPIFSVDDNLTSVSSRRVIAEVCEDHLGRYPKKGVPLTNLETMVADGVEAIDSLSLYKQSVTDALYRASSSVRFARPYLLAVQAEIDAKRFFSLPNSK